MTEVIDPVRAKGMVHEQIAATAKGLARAFWEDSATRSNQFYKLCPDIEEFVSANWHEFAPIARSIMVTLLADPKFPEAEKIKIHDALLKDGAYNTKPMSKKNTLITEGALLDRFRTTAVETPSGLILPPSKTQH